MLVVKYNTKNFFGDIEYREDTKKNPTYDDIKKAFHFLKKSHDIAIAINNSVIFWDFITDFRCNSVTVREYDDNNNYREFLWDYEQCKDNYYKIYKNV